MDIHAANLMATEPYRCQQLTGAYFYKKNVWDANKRKHAQPPPSKNRLKGSVYGLEIASSWTGLSHGALARTHSKERTLTTDLDVSWQQS